MRATPDTPDLALDHCGCIVDDLAAGAARWERLGFTLTPLSPQRGAVPGKEGFHPWATANRCVILRKTYLELIGVTKPDAFNPWAQFIAKNEGLHILALRADHADAAYASLSSRSEAFREPVPRERMLDVGGESRAMRFRNIFSKDEIWPEARYLVIEHQTPDYLWQPRYQTHANGACELVSVTFVADDPATLLPRMHALGAEPSMQSAHEITAKLPRRGTIHAMRSDAFEERYGCKPATRTGMHAIAASFEDLAGTLRLLEERGVEVHRTDERAWLTPNDANGFTMELVQAGARE